MTDHFSLLVPGATADGKIEVFAPYDCSLIATVDTGGSDAVDTALQTADARSRDTKTWLTAE
jgi:acyl-CoA reductase-like NAD-dependent aldehyde dehydrogenase